MTRTRINGSRAGLPRQKQSAEKWPTDTLHDPNRKRLVLEFPSPRLFLPFYSIRSKESGIRMPRYAKRNRERGRGRGRNLYLFDVERFKTSFPREYFFFLFLVYFYHFSIGINGKNFQRESWSECVEEKGDGWSESSRGMIEDLFAWRWRVGQPWQAINREMASLF